MLNGLQKVRDILYENESGLGNAGVACGFCTGFSLLHLGFSLVVASGGYSSMQCMGLLILGASLWSVGSRMKGF